MNDTLEHTARTAAADEAGVIVDPMVAVRAPAGSLLASAAEIGVPFDTWRRGINWPVHPTAAIRRPLPLYYGADTPCPDDLDMCRPEKTDLVTLGTWPTIVSFADGCMLSDLSFDAWPEHVRAALEAETSAQLAEYLWTGVSGLTTAPADFVTESTSFANTATVNDTPLGPVAAFASLIKAMRDADYRGGLWFHAHEALLPTLLYHGLVTLVGNTWRMGSHVVVLDAGYPRDIGTADDNPTDAQCYVVVTGKVEYGLGPIDVTTPSGSEFSCNDPTWEARRLAIARFATTPPSAGEIACFAQLTNLWES